MTFKDLGLSESLLKALDDCGYTDPTPIQAKAIPHILMARDVVGIAQTGTGKTAGFTVPMIEILAGGRAKARMPRSLILSPTRELAGQIAENFDTYGTYTKLSKALLVGGVSMGGQIKKMEQGVDVLIATPGRLMDLFERGQILLNDIRVLVIDEADRMLDMGFIPDIEKIVGLLPFTRQTLLFSATMEPEIKRLAEKFLSSPREVSVDAPASTAKNVTQYLVWTSARNKKTVLERLIKQEKVQNAFIFCNRKRDIDGVLDFLKRKGYNAEGLHGDMAQKNRTETLKRLKDGKVAFLVCSDVAARGLDVDGLSHVFNYDVPMNPDDYVHRIGRTGRAGKEGAAWSLAAGEKDKELVERIEKRIAQAIPVSELGDKGKTSSGNRSSSSGSAEDEKPKTRSKSQEKSKPKPKSKTEGRPKKASRSHSQKDGESDDGVTGFGDDVPAFLKIGG